MDVRSPSADVRSPSATTVESLIDTNPATQNNPSPANQHGFTLTSDHVADEDQEKDSDDLTVAGSVADSEEASDKITDMAPHASGHRGYTLNLTAISRNDSIHVTPSSRKDAPPEHEVTRTTVAAGYARPANTIASPSPLSPDVPDVITDSSTDAIAKQSVAAHPTPIAAVQSTVESASPRIDGLPSAGAVSVGAFSIVGVRKTSVSADASAESPVAHSPLNRLDGGLSEESSSITTSTLVADALAPVSVLASERKGILKRGPRDRNQPKKTIGFVKADTATDGKKSEDFKVAAPAKLAFALSQSLKPVARLSTVALPGEPLFYEGKSAEDASNLYRKVESSRISNVAVRLGKQRSTENYFGFSYKCLPKDFSETHPKCYQLLESIVAKALPNERTQEKAHQIIELMKKIELPADIYKDDELWPILVIIFKISMEKDGKLDIATTELISSNSPLFARLNSKDISAREKQLKEKPEELSVKIREKAIANLEAQIGKSYARLELFLTSSDPQSLEADDYLSLNDDLVFEYQKSLLSNAEEQPKSEIIKAQVVSLQELKESYHKRVELKAKIDSISNLKKRNDLKNQLKKLEENIESLQRELAPVRDFAIPQLKDITLDEIKAHFRNKLLASDSTISEAIINQKATELLAYQSACVQNVKKQTQAARTTLTADMVDSIFISLLEATAIARKHQIVINEYPKIKPEKWAKLSESEKVTVNHAVAVLKEYCFEDLKTHIVSAELSGLGLRNAGRYDCSVNMLKILTNSRNAKASASTDIALAKLFKAAKIARKYGIVIHKSGVTFDQSVTVDGLKLSTNEQGFIREAFEIINKKYPHIRITKDGIGTKDIPNCLSGVVKSLVAPRFKVLTEDEVNTAERMREASTDHAQNLHLFEILQNKWKDRFTVKITESVMVKEANGVTRKLPCESYEYKEHIIAREAARLSSSVENNPARSLALIEHSEHRHLFSAFAQICNRVVTHRNNDWLSIAGRAIGKVAFARSGLTNSALQMCAEIQKVKPGSLTNYDYSTDAVMTPN